MLGDAHAQEQRPLGEPVVGGEEHHGGGQRRPQRGSGEPRPHQGGQHAELADAGVGEHRLGVALADAHQGGTDGTGQAHRQHGAAEPGDALHGGGLAQRQGRHPAHHPGLDHGPAEHGAGRRRRHRVGQGQPEVQARHAGLDPETEPQQHADPGALLQRGEPLAQLAQGQHSQVAGAPQQAAQDQPLAEHRHDQVGAPAGQGIPGARVDHQAVGGEGHHREAQVEAGDVLGHQQQQVAGESQRPEHGETGKPRGRRAVAGGGPLAVPGQIAAGIPAGEQPQQRGERQQHPARLVQPPDPAQQPGRHQQLTVAAQQRQGQRRQRRRGPQRVERETRLVAPGQRRHQRLAQHQRQRPEQGGDHQGGEALLAHGRYSRLATRVAHSRGL